MYVCIYIYIYIYEWVFYFLYLMYQLNVLTIYDITITALDMFRHDFAVFRDYIPNLKPFIAGNQVYL